MIAGAAALAAALLVVVLWPRNRETIEEWARRRVRENRERAKRAGGKVGPSA